MSDGRNKSMIMNSEVDLSSVSHPNPGRSLSMTQMGGKLTAFQANKIKKRDFAAYPKLLGKLGSANYDEIVDIS